MTNASSPPGPGNMLEGIEVVELSEVDLDFAMEEMFQQGAPRSLETTTTELASPEELLALDLFKGLNKSELAALTARCQSIQAVPGYVLLASGRLNTKVFFVVEGQVRLYSPTNDKRPVALVDVGHSVGLQSALTGHPVEHSVIATEISNIIAVDVATLDELAQRHHGFALKYVALQASYVRGDNCLYIGARSRAAARHGYIDELTLLHNQHWLTTMLPRLVARLRLLDKPLAVVAFAIDKFEEITKTHGIGAGLRALEAVGHWTLDQTRPVDILAVDKSRYIFAFLPDGNLDAARQLAARLKTAITTLPISLGPDKGAPITITLSFGVAALEKGMKENEFLAKTEDLVKKSLSLGGNCLSESL